jgi:hypothetical protein
MAISSYPTGALYVDTLQNTRLCFQDADLRGASLRNDRLGRPRAISGNFASVFSLTATNGRRYAVKCFTREVPDQEQRYKAISDRLAGLNHSWQVGFDYLRNGVLVGSTWYPVLKMEWADATNLTRWIEQHLHQPGALAELAGRFAGLVAELSASDIGHGDLQHGNLLVAPDGTLRLVDYDGMYVPRLAGLPSAELGHRNYQPPGRSPSDFGPGVDRFSAWVVYLSLVGLAVDPMLWSHLREPEAEHLLLAEEDFVSPDTSYRLGVLTSHSNKDVRLLAEQLRATLTRPGTTLPDLAPVALDAVPLPPAPTVPSSQGALPAWMADHVVAEPLPMLAFSNRVRSLRALGGVTAVTVLLAVLATVPGFVVAVTAPLLLAMVWVAWSMAAYRRQPETAKARDARAQARQTGGELARAAAAVSQLDRQAHQLDQRAERVQAQLTSRQTDLKNRQQHVIASEQRKTQLALAAVDTEIGKLGGERARVLTGELARIQAEHVRGQLARSRIADAKLPGIGPKLLANLRIAGIVTAADFTGVRYVAGQQYNTKAAYFVLPSGRDVRVTGIAEVKAGTLDRWRGDHETRARTTQPSTVPAAVAKAIESQFATKEAALRTERGTVTTTGDQRCTRLRAQHAAELNALGSEIREANTEAARGKAEHARKLHQARAVLDVARTRHTQNLANVSACANISYGGFARFVMGRVR